MMYLDKIERVRQTLKAEKYATEFRCLDVTYIWGPTGTGKTRGVMEEHDYDKVCRVTDYDHPFERYNGEDTLVFDEFRSQLRISDMLNYLDGYPLMLPCRYANRQACYTKVYLISNVPLENQYRGVQMDEPLTWKAFLRRIQHCRVHRRRLQRRAGAGTGGTGRIHRDQRRRGATILTERGNSLCCSLFLYP